MWNSSNSSPSVLIVENNNGEVFIIEDVPSKPSQIDRILKTEKGPKSKRKVAIIIETREPSPIAYEQKFKQEDEEIIEEYLEEYFDDEDDAHTNHSFPVPFIDPNISEMVVTKRILHPQNIEIEIIEERGVSIPEAILDHQYMIPQQTFDGSYSSDEFHEPSDDEILINAKAKPEKKNEGKPVKHKFRQLTGKAACKYCDTIFNCKDNLKMHICKYLQCDPKNYICRICNKELSKKTFSNHLHETLDCQYCGKKFVNPRNMRSHLQKMHQGEKYVPPKSPNHELYQEFENQDETMEPLLDETTGLLVTSKPIRKKYPRRKERCECDLCGRIFTTVRTLKIHMDLHTNNHRYVCQICGEKYTTHTGIAKHACLNKKRKRPEVDFRIFDVRHCKFCGKSFECLEDNKAHACEYQFLEDPKMFRCRFCMMDMSKNSYNKHMGRHLAPEKDWVCGFCNKKLSDEAGLNIHLTTHTGDRPFKCPYEGCGQSFISKLLLVRHSRFHGAEIPVYTCQICNKEVASKYHLKSHMKIHSDIVECQLCKMEFETRDALKEHYQESHQPYHCAYCDKTFTLPRYLKMHEKLHNPIEKVFKCEFCLGNKTGFTKFTLLTNHVFKVHTENFDEWKQTNQEIFKINLI